MNNYLLNMTKRILLVGMFLFCAGAGWAQVYQNGVRKGQIKVKFTSAMTSSLSQMKVSARSSGLTTGIEKLDVAAKKAGATNMYRLFPYDAKYESKLRKHGLHLWYVVEIKDNADPKTAVAQFKQLQEVTAAEVEREKVAAPYTATLYKPTASPTDALPFNDPMLKDQWHYKNTNQNGFGDADINLFEAWSTTAGANNIVVSVHDMGVDVNHKDLKANIWVNQAEANGTPGVDDDHNGYVDDINGYNFDKNSGTIDPQYHATHVAGTIAAVNNNGIGVSGIAGGSGHGDGAKIMSLQIFGEASTELTYVYAANNGAVISQNSWGYSNTGDFEQSVLDAIDYFIAEAGDYPGSPMKGGIVIFAAGNSNWDGDWYPGYHASILSVASVGPEWKKAAYSNYGNWVEVAAPGGDEAAPYGNKGGVLSTYPKDQYAYIQGTSMACPHVSGIAALVLANRDHQLTNTELWNKLVTGVVDIDQYNENYIGKLGSGALDAALAIQNDQHIAPNQITDLAITGISQEFATIAWTVPGDNDDAKPVSFAVYHNTQPITSANLSTATKVDIKNKKVAGTEVTYEIDGLLGVTTYYFAITSTDRWGNVSVLSNVVTETTNQGPSIAVDENSQNITMEIDVTGSTTATHDITVLNQASGILRWGNFMRHSNVQASYNAAALNYPTVTKKKAASEMNVAIRSAHAPKNELRSIVAMPSSFEAISKSYVTDITNLIGETDTSLTNSAGARFYVSDSAGFNLTTVQMYLKHDPAKGPFIIEVYKGSSPTKNNLVYAQEHSNYSSEEGAEYITLNEQLYFEPGSIFWVVFHIPSGNLFPLGIGYEKDETSSTNCFMSFDLGATWSPLEEALGSKYFAWAITVYSNNEYLGNYLTLEPGTGEVAGNEEMMTTLTAEASTLVNGSYSANLVLTSNDALQRELRIPVSLTVSGQIPNIKHIDIADYGSVFMGTEKTLEIVLENIGYGNFNEPTFTTSNPAFEIIDGTPWQIEARGEVVVKIKFSPTTSGNINGSLDFTNGNQSYQIALIGIGAETSKIDLNPETQIVNNITIGDEVTAQILVENNGEYPLRYFVPGFDTKGISANWPTTFHTYGYKVRSNQSTEPNPIPYEFQDIKTTGVDITKDLYHDTQYFTLDMGFDFPYYGKKMQTLYVTRSGFTTFDNTIQPLNTPSTLGNKYNPRGYISPLGTYFTYIAQGKIFYQVEADRVIVQYDNVWDGTSVGETITAQMVLFANGDIRFYYDNMGYSGYNQKYLNILIEDYDRKDGIVISNYDNPTELFSGLALGFDYPGPNIITKIENGSGVVTPGNSVEVSITMKTDSLAEGMVNRFVNFISNDPSKAQATALVQLEMKYGGTPKAIFSTDTIAFGNVFQGAVKSQLFTLKNKGSANLNITSMVFVNSDFTLVGDQPTSIKPGMYKNYTVQVPTTTLATLEDWLSINYADGSHDTVYVTAKVVVAPAIDVDLSLLQQTLAFGDSISIPFTIANTGLGTLEVAATGKQWLSFDAPIEAENSSYSFEKHNTGSEYQWFDLRDTGTKLPFIDWDNTSSYWRELTLPFPVEYFGKQYTSFKVGENGIISFEEDPKVDIMNGFLPTEVQTGPCVMPYWTNAGFNPKVYPVEEIGIFYQYFSDKIIVMWRNLDNGISDPASAEIIFYKNGTMKFQYKEERDTELVSRGTAIGLQKDSVTAVVISDHLDLDHGKGLAYVIIPTKTLSVAPNSTLTGQINIDARNVYGGVYNETLKIQSNVPGSENLEKPIELTVTGEANFVAEDTVDFGSKMISFDQYGSTNINSVPCSFSNDGSAPYDITWAQMADGNQGFSLQLYLLADLFDGFGGPSKDWQWINITDVYSPWVSETPVYTVNPGDQIKARAIFYPSTVGDFTDIVVVSTSIGDQNIVLKGSAFDAPVLEIDKTPIIVAMNTMDETASKSFTFNNINGQSDLNYEISIDFGRAAASSTSTETMATTALPSKTLTAEKAAKVLGARIASTYNRILTYTDHDSPDGHAGTGGAESLTIGTKYNAGPEGFNLSHVETWFRTETLNNGVVHVEIRAGGSTIANAIKIAESSLEFTGSTDPEGDEEGAWYQVALDAPVGIYPNEDFYVVVTLPSGIERPIGFVNDQETIPGRYYYEEQGVWGDIQEVAAFTTSGWLMYAAEETAGNSSWLSITTTLTGTLAMGESTTTDLLFDGAYAQRGDNVANIVIKTNDPYSTTVKVPVKLHLNEGPHFVNKPSNIYLAENDTLTLNINVKDIEGNTFTLAPVQTYKGVTYTFIDGILTIVLTPDFGDAGNYTYTFKATDEYDAVSELNLSVEVVPTNQPPVFIADTNQLEYATVGKEFRYELTDFFNDGDGDDMAFTVSSSNTNIVDVFSSTNRFIVLPVSMGEATLAFTVTDIYGAELKDTITVTVNTILGLEKDATGGVKVYPNPVQQFARIHLDFGWNGAVMLEVIDATGKKHITEEVNTSESRDIQLNVSSLKKGFYILRAASADKTVSVKLIKE